MTDDLYFDGDPATDSRRRHLERVLKDEPPRRRWPWVAAVVAGGGAWALWRMLQRPPADGTTAAGDKSAPEPGKPRS